MLGLARALFDTPDILILDEGLNSLDIQIENVISNIIREYAQNHAVMLITHRVTTLLKTDYLYILKDGRIIQEGEPEELLRQEGYFKKIWKLHKESYS
jgi:ATP-binding cassette subfamily B protein